MKTRLRMYPNFVTLVPSYGPLITLRMMIKHEYRSWYLLKKISERFQLPFFFVLSLTHKTYVTLPVTTNDVTICMKYRINDS